MRERGLKPYKIIINLKGRILSLPMRERGLKQKSLEEYRQRCLSLPMRERGLKHLDAYGGVNNKSSLPMRERGLKLGAVTGHGLPVVVAPHAGAWIETSG